MFSRNIDAKKMNTLNKNALSAIALILVLTFSAIMAGMPTAKAHSPPWTFATYSYVTAIPSPVGVGEQAIIVFWTSPNPPSAAGLGGDRWRGMMLTITKPDGTTETRGPFYSDATGSTYTLFTPTQVGTYKVAYTYPGQVLSLYGPGGYGGLQSSTNMNLQVIGNPASPWIGDTFTSSSASTAFTVVQTATPLPPVYPLPTSYWTRPIEGENTNWASISSNFLGGASIYGRLQPDGLAPTSSHVMWTKPLELGGIVGGTTAPIVGGPDTITGVGYYSGSSYEGRDTSPLIIGGKLIYPDPLGHSGSGGGYTAVDLLTGQTLWHSNMIGNLIGNTSAGAPNVIPLPTFGQLFDYESQNQHGVVGGILWQVSTVGVLNTANITWAAFDPFTGNWMFNETGVPPAYTIGNVTQSIQDIYTAQGQIVRYVLNYNNATQKGWLALWNNTCQNQGLELVDPFNGVGTNAYQWRPNGKSVDMSRAFSWNVTIGALPGVQYDTNFNIVPSYPAIIQVLPGDTILGRSSTFVARGGTVNPYTLWAISDKPATRGQILWIKNYPAPSGNLSRQTLAGTVVDPVNRVFFMGDLETMQDYGFSLDTGEQLWGPIGANLPAFQYYGTIGSSGVYGYAAYGNLYVQGGYSGLIQCYNDKTGQLLWTYGNGGQGNSTNSGDNTPWGNYPLFIGMIADGKIYAYTSEHSFNSPIYKGETVRCINATTGSEIWSLYGTYGVGGFQSGVAPIADGYLAYYNYYDNSLYCIGKGPSATTIEAPLTAITQGSSLVIQGTVTDQSAGTKQNAQAADFPNGVPAVSDASMSAWMEYVYMQKPMPANATGVPVTLTALDPNGNTENIGTVTSDVNGHFGLMWTPPVPGYYTITATFCGSNSYYGSYAETAIGVSAAAHPSTTTAPSTTPSSTGTPAPTSAVSPSVAPTPAQPASSAASSTTLYIVAAAAVIIIVIAAAAIVLRKRK